MRKGKNRVLIRRYGQKSVLYFRNYVYNPSKGECGEALMAAIGAGKCSYGDVSQVSHGEISLSFNPLKQTRKTRKNLENEFKQLIEAHN